MYCTIGILEMYGQESNTKQKYFQILSLNMHD